MHFTIPYVEEVNDNNGKKIDIFKIYINGAHHCSARFSVLHKLYEDLKLRFTLNELPYFPPKKFLKLNETQLEERRESLEYFLQKVSSSTRFNSHEFHEFLKTCQKETKKIVNESVRISVYLMDGQQHQVDIRSTDNTQSVFDAFADAVNLPRRISPKFGLYFIELHSDDKFSIIRKIQDFEYPYISLNEILTQQRNRNRSNSNSNNCRIVVRKSIWNAELETEIDSSHSALEILFAQVAAEIANGWIGIPDESRRSRMMNLIQRKALNEALHLARTLDFYGYVQLHGRSVCNRPALNTPVIVSAGNFQLVLRDASDNGNPGAVLLTFCLTRIKAWKISTSLKDQYASGDGDGNGGSGDRLSPRHEHQGSPTMTFEYLDAHTKNLEEVIITNSYTDQIILLSMSLKNMAEEYVNYKASRAGNNSQSGISSDIEAKLVKHKSLPNGSHNIGSSCGYRANLMSSYYIGDGDL